LKIRALTYVAAVLSALGILTVALSIAFFVWWRRVSCALRWWLEIGESHPPC
jgi:hypothetical protein